MCPGFTEQASETTSVKMENDSPNNKLNSVSPQSSSSSHEVTTKSDTLETGHNDKDLLSEADPQQKEYGIELSQEDQITLLLQATDSKLSDIR